MNNLSYLKIKQYINENTGIVYYRDKDKDLSHKIEKRMQALGIGNYDAYWDLLLDGKSGAKEFDQLVNTLTIGETYFFRDKAVFKGLSEYIIPQVVEKNRQTRSIRIWSAGCATGEETYSLSILLKREFANLLSGWDVMILGTDINRGSIAQAIEGRYSEWSFRETPEAIKHSCFIPVGKTWQLKPEYKIGTNFEYHNLVKNPFPSLVQNLVAFDIILNRNVIIYFDEHTTVKLIGQFESSLVESGWFIVGHADHNIKHYSGFKAVSFPGAYFYQKKTEAERSEKPNIDRWYQAPVVPSMVPRAAAVTPAPTVSQPLYTPYPAHTAPTTPTPHTSQVKHPPQPLSPRPTAAKVKIDDSEIKQLCGLANRGEWYPALTFSRQLLEKDNLEPTIYFLQALIREQMGQVQEAEQLLRKVLYLDRNFVPGHYHLGLLLQKKQNLKAAKKSFENARSLLDKYEPGFIFEIADHISAAQLKELAEFNLEVLENYDNQR